jgi:hypothetical protein
LLLSTKLIFSPMRARPKIEIPEPNRVKLRTDKELAVDKKSATDIEEPMRAHERKEMLLPMTNLSISESS